MSDKFFDDLQRAAKHAYDNAYAPYSNFSVGAAALTFEDKIITGCNVENASYGLTVCAERNCLASGIVQGEQKFRTIVIYTETSKLTPPCGACRQVISEFLEPNAIVSATNQLGERVDWSVAELLPDAFTPKDLE
ncbi:cytidine deaminase [Thalassotalea crassostreae]|uniref:cytidine deaminase n=1 Tax=Thalassotalea crassostreae TaxID=1763536 RepID=UPI000838E18D|nr:cytidine deaminase [Thalassotalea crassostreae]